ncbi:hypothetical protein [Leisingera aquimarina]|uniref:hypothetical protein n=1 Tax=Leisingera aquimarina TaxID=476529 RepID=UPI0012ECB5FA|nr:hypothetical protein [Leisingera aquimarina]
MVKVFTDHSDQRHNSWCYHCSRTLGSRETNREHIPTKNILTKPYPENLPVAAVCAKCNESYSLDEQYFIAFLSAVLSGTTDPNLQVNNAGKSALKDPKLRGRIERSKREYLTIGGERVTLFEPEVDRVKNVAIKNARGHVFFENGEPKFEEPIFCDVFPLQTASDEQLDAIFPLQHFDVWPEVGSRWMQRLIAESGFDDQSFYVVQPEVYRFRLDFDHGVTIRSVIHEYLATIVAWEF